jgi:mannose-6-phosphate isomerase class I
VPNIITGKTIEPERVVYQTPAPDFELSRLNIEKGKSARLISRSIEIFLLFSGTAQISGTEGAVFKRNKGEAWVTFDAAHSEVVALEDTIIFQASIPGMK